MIDYYNNQRALAAWEHIHTFYFYSLIPFLDSWTLSHPIVNSISQ